MKVFASLLLWYAVGGLLLLAIGIEVVKYRHALTNRRRDARAARQYRCIGGKDGHGVQSDQVARDLVLCKQHSAQVAVPVDDDA